MKTSCSSSDVVRLPRFGRRANKFAKALLVFSIIAIVVLGSIGSWLPGLATMFGSIFSSFPVAVTSSNWQGANSSNSNSPNLVGADGVPNISFPQSILSHPDELISSGGIINDSPENLTIYNFGVIMRLLGGNSPHDELLGIDHEVLSSWSFWSVEVNVKGDWLPLVPVSNLLSDLGTNQTGSYVIRTIQVTTGAYGGTLQITYKAVAGGPLKWALSFTPTINGVYRLVYKWDDVSAGSQLSVVSKTFRVPYRFSNYTLAWSDIDRSLNESVTIGVRDFDLGVNLGHITAGSTVNVDPSVVSTSTYSGATDYAFQRKVFQDPTGRYFVFYYDGFSIGYRSSSDGINWSAKQSLPSSWPNFVDAPTSLVSVADYGNTVVIAAGDYVTIPSGTSGVVSAYVHYAFGIVSGGSIVWGAVQTSQASTYNCNSFPFQLCPQATLGVRYLYDMFASNGDVAFAYNAFNSTSCCPTLQSVGLVYVRSAVTYTALIESYSGTGASTGIVLPEGNPTGGVVNVVYGDTQSGVDSVTYSSVSQSLGTPITVIGGFVVLPFEFSAASDAEYNIHLAVTDSNSGQNQVGYVYHQAGSSSWVDSSTVFPSILNGLGPPLVSVDSSTDTVFVASFLNTGTNQWSVIMNSKSPSQDPTWKDSTYSYQFKGRPMTQSCSTMTIGSSSYIASSTNASTIPLLWTECNGGSVVAFGSIPIQTTWSPYSYPNAPWNGKGIAPYGQYFQSLDESVSPSSGTLTIGQTDLSLPGRGLTLSITRTFDGASFYSPAPIGAGWTLNLPWVDVAANQIHLWNGASYAIPARVFGTGCPCTWENRQGEYFKFVAPNNGTAFLYTKTGLVYRFTGPNQLGFELSRIVDPTSNNIETLGYSGNYISSISDSIGRVVLFCYNANNYVSAIEQVSGGACGTEVGLVRKVSYFYIGPFHIGSPYSLASVTDPAGRATQFQYNAVFGASNFVISRVIYPTTWYSNYTYKVDTSLFGFTTYRVSKQIIYSSSNSIIRQTAYTYFEDSNTGAMDKATVTAYNGTAIAGYTDYSFSFTGVKWNVSDSSHNLVRGDIQLFGVHGEVPQETILVTDGGGHIGSYTNYFRYDSWGDLIYTHTIVSSAANWYHDSFNSYYNNGFGPGFNAFQETFSSQNGTQTDNVWSTYNGTWRVVSGQPYGLTSDVFNTQSYVSNPSNPATFFAWSNATGPNASVIASVYVPQQTIYPEQRVGIFAHYPGSGTRKWGLVLHFVSGGATYLSLLDENLPWVAQTPCNFAYNTWYRFNFTISGRNAWGSANAPNAPGGAISCSVSGSFTSNDITTATRFGLYSGGISTMYSNVTLTTVAPGITGTRFSNSFFNSGAPNTAIHGLIAGTAQLQNGTNSLPIETYYSYYPWGGLNQVKQRYNAQSGIQWITNSRTYDTYGNLATAVDSRGNNTYYSFSTRYQNAYLTNQTQILKPGGTKITRLYSYNFTMGTTLSSVDPNGFNTTYQYDILGRTKLINYPQSLGFLNYTYNDAGNYVDSMNENGWKTRQYFDGLGRVGKVTRFLNGSPYANVTTTHSWQDKVINQIDSLGNISNYTYDALGRLTQTKKPDGNITRVSYNDFFSYVVYTDEYLNHRCSTYDRLGRLLSVVESSDTNCNAILINGSAYVTNYYYDETSNLSKVVTANTKTTTYSHDNLNRLTQTSYPDGTSESYVYDNSGNIVSKTDRSGVQTSYAYDSLNKVSLITYRGSTTTHDIYTYDKNANLVMLQSQNTTLSDYFDPRNRMTCEMFQVNGGYPDGPCYNGTLPPANGTGSPYGYSYQYYYTGGGENMIMLTYNDFMAADYTYDGLGRVATVRYSFPGVTSSFSYFPNDKVKGIVYGNGLVENFTYTKNGQVQQIKLNGTISPLLLNYQYNKTGTVSKVSGQIMTTAGSILGVSESYRYDSLGRLTNSTTATGSTLTNLWYMYDPVGNRIAQGLNGTATGGSWQKTTYNYNSNNNELSSSTGNNVTTQYSYDPNGNLLTKSIGTTTHWNYTWNVQGQLPKVIGNSVVQGYYAYDGLGRRVESKETSTAIFGYYLGTETLGETGFFPDNDYVYVDGLRIAMVNNDASGHPTVVYYHTDALGSTRLVTSSTKSTLFSDAYQPFGQDNYATGSQTYRFTGKPVSQTTGLYYYYHRWYDPSIGRFVSADPAAGSASAPQSLNLYVYVRDDPSTIDPTGENPFIISPPDPVSQLENALIKAITTIVISGVRKGVAALSNIVNPIISNYVTPGTAQVLKWTGNLISNPLKTATSLIRGFVTDPNGFAFTIDKNRNSFGVNPIGLCTTCLIDDPTLKWLHPGQYCEPPCTPVNPPPVPTGYAACGVLAGLGVASAFGIWQPLEIFGTEAAWECGLAVGHSIGGGS